MKCLTKCWLVAFGLLVSNVAASAQEDLAAKLRAFEEKIAAPVGDLQGRSSEVQGRAFFLAQVKILRAALVRNDINRVKQMVERLSGVDLPPEWRAEWIELSTRLITDSEKLQASAEEQWRAQVDALLGDTQTECPKAKSAAALDPLLLRCAALQMQRFERQDVVNQRAVRKLAGIVDTLQNWVSYLDYREAGNAKAANNQLRILAANAQFPVLRVTEIEAHFLPLETNESGGRGALRKILSEVTALENLESAMAKIRALATQADESSNFQAEKTQVENLLAAWQALQAGDHETAIRVIERHTLDQTGQDAQAQLNRLKSELVRHLLVARLKPVSAIQPASKEDPSDYLARVLADLRSKGEFTTVVDLMKLGDRLFRTNRSLISQDRIAIERYLAGLRFEKAGDVPAAIGEYRSVVSAATGPYGPANEAGEALRRLQEKHPALFTDLDGIVLQEIRSLRQQILMLLNRPSPGRPPF